MNSRKNRPPNQHRPTRERRRRTCVYCANRATTRDHVPPRLLLEKPYPNNLITVPACNSCNNEFSADEEYFLTILAHVATANSLVSKIADGGVVDRALSASAKKSAVLESSLQATNHDGVSIWLQPDWIRVGLIVRKIAQGLYYHRYNQAVADIDVRDIGAYPYNIRDQRPPEIIAATHSERFLPKKWQHIQPGIFSYIFVRHSFDQSRLTCVVDVHSTAWLVASFPSPIPVPSNGRKTRHRTVVGQLRLSL